MFLLFTIFIELKYGFQKSQGLKNVRVLGKRPLTKILKNMKLPLVKRQRICLNLSYEGYLVIRARINDYL